MRLRGTNPGRKRKGAPPADSSGNTLAQMGHFPFGESWYNATNDKLLFTTYERDTESGNDYAQARYNVSRLGRFSSPDALAGNTADPQSLNRYSYVRNMPVMLTDPSGLCITAQNQDRSRPLESGIGGPTMSDADDDAVDLQPQQGQAGCPEPSGGGVGLDGGDITAGPGQPGFPVGGDAMEIIGVALSPTGFMDWGLWGSNNGDPWYDEVSVPIYGNLGLLSLLFAGQFHGGPMDVSALRGNALVALVSNPDCANLFGGISNSVASLFNSSYNWYVPGQSNPFPNQIPPAMWQATVATFDSGALGLTEPHYGRRTPPGDTIFFRRSFGRLPQGFGTGSQQYQMTVFMHEQEHAANHYEALDNSVDSNYPLDAQKINSLCKLHPIEQETVPITGQLTPP